MKKLSLFFFAVVPILYAGYTIKLVEVLPLESYPARVSKDNITIAVDPYPDNKKSSTAFDVNNLNSMGFFPVHVIIRNETPYYLKLKTQSILLENRLGENLYSTPAALVVQDLIGNKFVDSLSHLREGDRLSDKVASPLSDFTTKELGNSLIEPDMIESGFLFFYSEKHKRSLFMGSTLLIPNLQEEGTERKFGPFAIELDPALSATE